MMFSNKIAQSSHIESSNTVSFYTRAPLKSLSGPCTTWKVFNRLQAATEYAEAFTKVCMIFSFEERVGNSGQRKFLVAHPEHFWHYYRTRPPEEKCSYEVIRENFPCKLYFDLEYYTAFNSTKNGIDMTEVFVKCVVASMYEQHGLMLLPSDFLWLDSSNDSKFSCHLILQMKDVAFQENTQAGTFVQILLSTLRKRMEDKVPSDGLWPPWEEIQTLFVKTKKENQVVFCDEGVYSRNRNFRVYLSTKYGKKCPLVLSPYNKHVPAAHFRNEEEAIFYSSLITYFRNQVTKFLTYEENVRSSSLSQPRRGKSSKSGVSGCTSSPFPELDAFILKIVSDPFAVGFIRKWTYFSKEQKVIYDIGNYRYCGNIGRHHKSNNIRIVADLVSKRYYQLCLDPECRRENYQSESRAISVDISFLNVPDDFFDGICFSQLESHGNDESGRNVSLDAPKSADAVRGSLKPQSENSAVCREKACGSERLEQWEISGDWELHFDDVKELEKAMNHRSDIIENNDGALQNPSSVEIEQDWDIFFGDDFTCSEIGTEHEKCEIPSPKDFSASFPGSLSPEEEMWMVEAADAVEADATGHEDIDAFDEETIF